MHYVSRAGELDGQTLYRTRYGYDKAGNRTHERVTQRVVAGSGGVPPVEQDNIRS